MCIIQKKLCAVTESIGTTRFYIPKICFKIDIPFGPCTSKYPFNISLLSHFWLNPLVCYIRFLIEGKKIDFE